MTCGLTRQSLMNTSSSWTNQQAITTKKPKPATLVPTKLNAREISAMTVKCLFCKDTKIEPGIPGPCVWCEDLAVIPKCEDVVVNLDAALGREAALREELETEKRANYNAKVALKAASETCELWKGRTTNLTHTNSALQQRLTVAEQRNVALEAALKFYADGDHLLLADADAWDTCSGEPINFLHDEAGTASVEDGSIAKAALKPAAEGEGS